MYVHKLDISWLDHPFLRNHFKIKNKSDVSKIRKSGVESIYIDTEKGVDIHTAEAEKKPVATVLTDSERQPEESPVSNNHTTSVAEEMHKARLVREEAVRVISGIMRDARLGKQVDTERVSPVVEQILGSIFRNQDAFLGLTRIRDRDEYTFEHSISVSALMIAFAKRLGFDEATVREVGVGGLLHDIGKLQVPELILNKPGRLTDQEFGVMRQHVRLGHRLIEECDEIPRRARQIIMQHHERLNGTGYPGGLSGEEISLYGKMAAIVDVYDAITSDRVYHKGKLPSMVLRQLVDWSREGVFDSELVQRFVQCVGIYPVGTLVELESQRLAVVIASSQNSLLSPLVKVIFNLCTERFQSPEYLDLANPGLGTGDRIIKSVASEKYNIKIADFLEG
jgi:putative nucleotidyltransferase with HDIG domain